jgi:hypothetical protein
VEKRVLITRPNYDLATSYLYAWSSKIFTEAETHGFEVLKLEREEVTSSKFQGIISKKNPNLVFLNGHGDEKTVFGQDGVKLLTAGVNEKLLAEKITYAVSCSSAKVLGPNSTGAGALGYIGYDAEFSFLIDTNYTSRPLQDKLAQVFLGHSTILLYQLLKGNTIEVAYKKAKAELKSKLIEFASTENSDPQIVQKLWWDMEHFVYHGNGRAHL